MAFSKLIALFFAFAVAPAATVQPSQARLQGLDRHQDAAAAAGGDQILHPSTHHLAPPSPPSSPGAAPPPQPSTHTVSPPPPPPQQPTECLTPLIGMMPCMGYLTNLTVLTPPGECCDGLKKVISDAPICLCHGMNGDMNRFMPHPVDLVRMLILPLHCGTMLPLQTLFSCNSQQVPPIMPPMPAPTPASPPTSS